MKLKKGDKVQVIAGKDKGKTGAIERVYDKQGTAMVHEINQYKRHIKKSEQTPEGGIVDVPRPIDVSKLMLVCPKSKKLTRVGYKIEKDKKIRVCRKCDKAI